MQRCANPCRRRPVRSTGLRQGRILRRFSATGLHPAGEFQKHQDPGAPWPLRLGVSTGLKDHVEHVRSLCIPPSPQYCDAGGRVLLGRRVGRGGHAFQLLRLQLPLTAEAVLTPRFMCPTALCSCTYLVQISCNLMSAAGPAALLVILASKC